MDSEIEEIRSDTKAWREVKYGKKFAHALRGLFIFYKTTKRSHMAAYIAASVSVIAFGSYFRVSSFEWIALVFSISSVFISEAFNTAIEIDVNLTSPEFHPYARDTKDVAAAAVFLSVIMAVLVGLIVFLPKIF